MTEERKPDASSQPSFAEMVRGLENAGKIFREGPQAEGIAALLACIREQQAALDEVVRIAEVHVQPGYLERARATLAKWRIE